MGTLMSLFLQKTRNRRRKLVLWSQNWNQTKCLWVMVRRIQKSPSGDLEAKVKRRKANVVKAVKVAADPDLQLIVILLEVGARLDQGREVDLLEVGVTPGVPVAVDLGLREVALRLTAPTIPTPQDLEVVHHRTEEVISEEVRGLQVGEDIAKGPILIRTMSEVLDDTMQEVNKVNVNVEGKTRKGESHVLLTHLGNHCLLLLAIRTRLNRIRPLLKEQRVDLVPKATEQLTLLAMRLLLAKAIGYPQRYRLTKRVLKIVKVEANISPQKAMQLLLMGPPQDLLTRPETMWKKHPILRKRLL